MEDLLSPSLPEDYQARPIYSARALFLVAFFGGAVPALIFAGLNSDKLKRLNRDLIFYLAAAVGVLVFYFLVLDPAPAGTDFFAWLRDERGRKEVLSYGPKALGLAVWMMVFFFHRSYWKGMSLVGISALNPWGPAIGCVLAGRVLQMFLVVVALSLKGML